MQQATYPVSEPYGLGYAGHVLYVCNRISGLLVFDIAQPYTPLYITAITDVQPVDVIPYGNTLIVWTSTGLRLYNITDPLRPALLTTID